MTRLMALRTVPAGSWTMEKDETKRVEIVAADNKRQIQLCNSRFCWDPKWWLFTTTADLQRHNTSLPTYRGVSWQLGYHSHKESLVHWEDHDPVHGENSSPTRQEDQEWNETLRGSTCTSNLRSVQGSSNRENVQTPWGKPCERCGGSCQLHSLSTAIGHQRQQACQVFLASTVSRMVRPEDLWTAMWTTNTSGRCWFPVDCREATGS